ncbi:hypothetical protein E5K00_07020 [Hymenobacter aquaticus]|uniref:DUF4843 domain-containing protein n=1 Tax=Hymenobacter aquaticus TaxID=1867101 RepID=A0A4Z0Q5Q9_9BACT|nr:hypothetical protein [Hymenobacter aquaticus]TGE24944.1 hypothetical protein E5K00_07020 [Hymenobacter aquaticus]
MTIFRTLKNATLLAVTAAGGLLTSCIEAPDYPDTPRIEFKEMTVERYRPGPSPIAPIDSVKITVDFTDGNGDLGLDASENSPPYDRFRNGVYNRNGDNYYVTVYRRSDPSKPFEIYPGNGPQGYNSRYPKLFTDGDKEGPLKGTLTFSIELLYDAPFVAGEELRFDISIADRALNESNKITTPSIIIQPK